VVIPISSDIVIEQHVVILEYIHGVIIMKQFNKKILTASILLALGSVSSAWANPTNTAGLVGDQTATATSDQNGAGIAANEVSTAENNTNNSSTNTSDNSSTNTSDNSSTDNSDHSSINTSDNSSTNTSDNSSTDNSNHSDNSSLATSEGEGSAAANGGGNATSDYKVNNSYLSGTVTGAAVNFGGGGDFLPTSSSYSANNTVTDSFNGSAGINQNVQNLGNNSLAQQQVSFQGNVNVNQPTAVAP